MTLSPGIRQVSLDVIVEELLEKLLGVVSTILSPGARASSLDIACCTALLLSLLTSSLWIALW